VKEYFVYTVSDPAPFSGDTDTEYIKASSPREALATIKKQYDHPCKLYYAAVYANADAYHKDKGILAEYKSSNMRSKKYG